MNTVEKAYQKLKSQMPEHDARYIIDAVTGVTWADIIAAPDRKLEPSVVERIREILARYDLGEPISRILGVREFWGLDFHLSPETLDPRSDSEVLVERALQHYSDTPPEVFADLGTGTGCLAIALLTEWPESRAILLDLSSKALETARKNAKHHRVEKRCFFVNGCWSEAFAGESLDCLIANPPYIQSGEIVALDENVQKYDPILALDGGQNGLQAYCDIFSTLNFVLKPGGKAFFEIGFDQGDDMLRLGEKYRIRIEAIYADYAGNPRVVDISRGDK